MTWYLWLTLAVVLLVLLSLLTLLYLALRLMRETQKETTAAQRELMTLLNKSMAIAASKDALSFQAIQAMDHFSPTAGSTSTSESDEPDEDKDARLFTYGEEDIDNDGITEREKRTIENELGITGLV